MQKEMPTRLARKAVYESDWVCLYQDTVRMPDGSVIDCYHQLHFPHESVSAVITRDNGDILLIRNRRYTQGQLKWEIPAGRIEQGESPEQAVRRECMEETGCRLRKLRRLCAQYPSNGMSDQRVHVFLAYVDTEQNVIDQTEIAGKEWLTRENIRTMLQDGTIDCGISMVPLLWVLAFNE